MIRSAADKMKLFARFWRGDQGLSIFLCLLLLLFLIGPFLDSHLADILVSVFLSLLLVTGIANITEKTAFIRTSVLVALTTLILSIVHDIWPTVVVNCLWNLSAATFFAILIYVLLHQVFREGKVTAHRIRGAVAIYLLFGLTWTFIYQLISLTIPGAFSVPQTLTARPGELAYQSSLVYFSFVTMTTLGYGDIVPVSTVARVFVIMEALIGQLYPATLLARLVSLQITHQERED